VTVNVSVRDRNAPVTTLTSADFVLTDNGVPQTVDAERTEVLPCDLTLLLDMSGSTAPVVNGYKEDVRNIVKMLRPTDRVRLMTFDFAVHEIFPFEPPTTTLPLDRLRPGSVSSLFEGLLFALPRAPNPDRQHLIVVFTDGAENFSVIDAKAVADAAAHSDALLEIALTSNPSSATSPGQAGRGPRVTITVVGPNQPATGWIPILRSIAEATGGEVRDADKSSSLKKTFETLLNDIRRSYVLRFTPTGVAAAGWHDLVVNVAGHPTFQVRARRGYFGG
jgi:hypothetical protein